MSRGTENNFPKNKESKMNIFNSNFSFKKFLRDVEDQEEVSKLEEGFYEESCEDDLDEDLCETSPQGIRERLFDKPYDLQGGEGLSDFYLRQDLKKANKAFLNCEFY